MQVEVLYLHGLRVRSTAEFYIGVAQTKEHFSAHCKAFWAEGFKKVGLTRSNFRERLQLRVNAGQSDDRATLH